MSSPMWGERKDSRRKSPASARGAPNQEERNSVIDYNDITASATAGKMRVGAVGLLYKLVSMA